MSQGHHHLQAWIRRFCVAPKKEFVIGYIFKRRTTATITREDMYPCPCVHSAFGSQALYILTRLFTRIRISSATPNRTRMRLHVSALRYVAPVPAQGYLPRGVGFPRDTSCGGTRGDRAQRRREKASDATRKRNAYPTTTHSTVPISSPCLAHRFGSSLPEDSEHASCCLSGDWEELLFGRGT